MQGLKLRLESETKELKQTQTKKSMEDAKILNLVSIVSYHAIYSYSLCYIVFLVCRIRESRLKRSGSVG